jgi:hypothetical protein
MLALISSRPRTPGKIVICNTSCILVNAAKVGDNKLEQRCWVGMSSNCIGLGDEIKFQDYNDWKFDYLISATDAKWSKAKNISSYAMPMIPDSRWKFCWYQQMGSYFAVENILWRSQEQKKHGLLNVVFPALNSYRDESATKKMTAVIRQNLYKDCPPRTTSSHLRPSHCVRVQLASSHCILISLYFRHALEWDIRPTLPLTHTLTPLIR